jgi:surface protein
MEAMFYGCSKLPSLDVSNFNTEKVSNMRQMFYYCSSLKELEVRNFNTEKVDRMAGMFNNCNQLYYLDLTGFDFSRADNILNFLDKTDTVYVYVPSDIPATTLDKITGTKTNNLIIGDSENGFTCVDCRFYDGNRDLRLPYPFMANAITYFRTIAKGGNGNTIMLPCDFDVPTGMKAYRMKGSAGQVTDDIIYFQEMAAGEPMLANTPYLIANWGNLALPQLRMNSAVQVDNTIDYYDLEGTTQLTSFDGTETISTTLKDGTQVTMYGTFRYMPNSEVADQGIYIFQAGNKWKQVKSSNTTAYIPPFRAYLTKSGGANGASLFNSSLISDDDVTGVSEIHAIDRNGDITRYDLNGRRISGSQGGIYVSKGKKVLTH